MSDPLWAPPGAEPSSPAPGASAAHRPGTHGRVARDIAVCLGVLLVLGALAGVVWWLLAPSPEFTKLRNESTMGEDQLSLQFAADAWYAVVAAVAGVLSGAGLTWWRDRDPLLTSACVLVGSLLAGGLMSWVGHVLGPGKPDVALATAKVGQHVPDQLVLHAHTGYLVWPIAALVGTLVVLFGRLPAAGADTDR
jgi:hypothetical protein